MTINMGEVGGGVVVLAEAFQEMLHPTRRLHPLGRLGLVTAAVIGGGCGQHSAPWSRTGSSLWPSAYRLAPAGTARHKVQEFLNSQTKEQSFLTALSQQVLPVHSRPQAGKISGHTHGFSTHPPTYLPILRAWAWGVSNASKASAQLAE